MDLSQHRSKNTKRVAQTEVKASIFKRFCRGICPCVSVSQESSSTTRASFLSDEKEDNTELNQINSIVHVTPLPPIIELIPEPRVAMKFKSTFQKGSSPKKMHDLVPHRSSSEVRSSNHPIMHFREMQLMTIGDSKCKMLAKVTSNRFIPSKESINKTKQISNKKQISLYENPNFEEFSRSRYIYFQKFDQGIKIDKQAWHNAIPEIIAEYIATRAKCTTILDGLCGIGSASIKFSNTCHTVIANDPSQDTLYCFDNNTAIYSADNIIKHNKQFIQLAGINPDVVFLHPKINSGLDEELSSLDPQVYFEPSLQNLLVKSFQMTNNVIMLLPGVIFHNALKIAQSHQTVSCSIEIQKIFFNKQLKYVIVYYGPTVNRAISMKEQLSFVYRILNQGSASSFQYKNVVKHIRSRYGMVQLLYLTSECLKYQKQTMMDRFFEMIRVNQLLSEKLLSNLMKSPQLYLKKQSTFEQEKYDEEDLEKESNPRNSSDRTNSFVTDEGDNIHFNRDQSLRQTIFINQNRKSQTFALSSNYESGSDISRGSLDRTKFNEE